MDITPENVDDIILRSGDIETDSRMFYLPYYDDVLRFDPTSLREYLTADFEVLWEKYGDKDEEGNTISLTVPLEYINVEDIDNLEKDGFVELYRVGYANNKRDSYNLRRLQDVTNDIYEFKTEEGAENSLKRLKEACGTLCPTIDSPPYGEGTYISYEYPIEEGKRFLIRFRVKNVVVVLFARVNKDLLADDITALEQLAGILEERLSKLEPTLSTETV